MKIKEGMRFIIVEPPYEFSGCQLLVGEVITAKNVKHCRAPFCSDCQTEGTYFNINDAEDTCGYKLAPVSIDLNIFEEVEGL